VGHAAASVGRHHDQIGGPLLGFLQDDIGDLLGLELAQQPALRLQPALTARVMATSMISRLLSSSLPINTIFSSTLCPWSD